MAKIPVTRIIRFEDPSGAVFYGEEPEEGVTEAVILEGDIYKGLTRSENKAEANKTWSYQMLAVLLT